MLLWTISSPGENGRGGSEAELLLSPVSACPRGHPDLVRNHLSSLMKIASDRTGYAPQTRWLAFRGGHDLNLPSQSTCAYGDKLDSGVKCVCVRDITPAFFSVFLFSFPFFIALFQWGHHIRESANSVFVRGSIMKASLTVKPQMLIKVPCLLICHVTVVCTMSLHQPFFSSAKGGGGGGGYVWGGVTG